MQIDRASITSEYKRREQVYIRLLDESFFVLERGLNSAGVKYHSIPKRIKTLDSLIAKAERKDDLADPFVEITDIVGLRVVCLFLSDITRVGQVIKNHFDVVAEDNKVEGQKFLPSAICRSIS
jgi:putative GTP pyrophosphokinase